MALGKNIAKKATGNNGPKKKAVASMKGYTKSLQKDVMTDKKQANKALNIVKKMQWNAQKNGNYQKARDYINQYANRPDFSYDVNADNLYKQYKNQYINNAQSAMRDTIAQQNAANGGFGSSYAGVAAQQQYQRELEGLNNVVPQLYEAAYNKYQDKGEAMLNSANAYQSMYGFDKDGFDTNLANRQWQQQVYENRKMTSADAYGNALQYKDQTKYQKARDKVADAQWNKEFGLAKASASSGSGGNGGGGGGTVIYDPGAGGKKKRYDEPVQTNYTTQMGTNTVPVYFDGIDYYAKNGSKLYKLDDSVVSTTKLNYNAAVNSITDSYVKSYAIGQQKIIAEGGKSGKKPAAKEISNYIIKQAKALGIGVDTDTIGNMAKKIYKQLGYTDANVKKTAKKVAKKNKKNKKK